MQRFAKAVDSLVGKRELLKNLMTASRGLKNEDLQKLLSANEDPRIQKRAALVGKSVSLEFLGALLSAAHSELLKISELSDPDLEISEPVNDPDIPSNPQGAPQGVQPGVEETEVNISLGEGVEVLYEDKDLYLKLPDNSVVKMSEATAKDVASISGKTAKVEAAKPGELILDVEVADGKVIFASSDETLIEASDKSVLKISKVSTSELEALQPKLKKEK